MDQTDEPAQQAPEAPTCHISASSSSRRAACGSRANGRSGVPPGRAPRATRTSPQSAQPQPFASTVRLGAAPEAAAGPTRRRPARNHTPSPLAVCIWLALVAAAQAQAQTRAAGHHCQRVGTREDSIACRCLDSGVLLAGASGRLEFEWPRDESSLVRLVSDQAGARFQLSSLALPPAPAQAEPQLGPAAARFKVQVNPRKRYQQVVGYGGAFTDSASMLIQDKLTPACRRQLMEGYFSPAGLNYNMARVPIGGTDMSWRPYSYDDLAEGQEDLELSSFALQEEDLRYKLPLIRWAHSMRPAGDPLKVVASSWSAPNWMKSNRNLVQGRIKDDAGAEEDERGEDAAATAQDQPDQSAANSMQGKYYDAYARYIIRFLDEYERQLAAPANATGGALKIWALTPQNEPCTPGRLGRSVVNYNSVNFDPAQMGRFIRRHLVPNLLRANRTARQLALFLWDDTLLGFDRYKEHLFGPASGARPAAHELALQTQAAEYVRGLALHWYSQALDKLPYRTLYQVRRWLPWRFSHISTEASFIGRPRAGQWQRAEKYARDMIENLRAGSVGWIDWNLALNLEGGPTWSGNFLDSAVLVDELSGSFMRNPMYYAIGHVSRFIRAQSYVIESEVMRLEERGRPPAAPTNSTPDVWRLVQEADEQTSELLVVAAENTEPPTSGGRWRPIAVVLLNRATNETEVELELQNCRSGAPPATADANRGLRLVLSPKSVTSLAFNC